MTKQWTYPDTTGWYEAEFEFCGHRFVSKMDTNSDMFPKVSALPWGIFAQMNQAFIAEHMGDITNWTKERIAEALATANEYAHEAVIELA